MKQIVKGLEQAIFGYDDDKGKEELEEEEELNRKFKNLMSKKRLQTRPQSNFKKIALAPHDFAGNLYLI